jgi:hypothetical protein
VVIFEIDSHFLPWLAGTTIFLFYASTVAEMTGAQHHTQLFLVRWGIVNFLP